MDANLGQLEGLIQKRKQRRPTSGARTGRKLYEHYGGPEGWADKLAYQYDKAENETSKTQLAVRISNAMESLDEWEREEPEVVPSEITDEQLVAAVQYLFTHPDALAASQSRPFGT